MFMSFDTAREFCCCDRLSPFGGDDCTKSGEAVGFAEPLGCRDLLGVLFDDRPGAGVEESEFFDE